MFTRSRSPRRIAAIALAVVGALAFTTAGHDAGHTASAKVAGTCTDKAKGTTTLLRTKTAVIFERRARTGRNKGDTVVFGCLFKKGANVLLGVDVTDEEIVQPTLAGNYAAFGQTFCFGIEDLCDVTVKVVDLRTGEVARSANAFKASQDADIVLDALRLTPSGFTGWIASGEPVRDPSLPDQVHALDSTGHRLLDSAPSISPKSFTLSGSTLSWKNAGETRTATLG